MKNNPLVSVLVPVYNVEEYLDICLISLINQSLKNIEIICVNDGSTDGSLEILNKYAKIDSRIKIVNKKNGGLPSARNAGLDIARGLYVAFVDSDDYVTHNMCERMYSVAKSKGADIVVCGANVFPNEAKAQQWLKDVLSPKNAVFKKNSVDVLLYQQGARPFIWRNLISKKLIDKYNFRLDENIIVGEDQAFQFKVFPFAEKIAFISDKLYNYRWCRSNSIMNNIQLTDYGRKLDCHIKLVNSIAVNWSKNGVLLNNEAKFFDWAIDFIYWDIIRVCASDRVKLCKEMCELLIKFGFYEHMNEISKQNVKHFEYMYSHINKEFNKPVISVVVPVEHCCDYLKECLNSVLNQTLKDIDVIVYGNNADEDTLRIVYELMCKDLRISLRMGGWRPVAELNNDAILSVKSDYIMFLKPYDHYYDNSAMEVLVSALKSHDVEIAGYIKNGTVGVKEISVCQCADFYSFAYKVDILRNKQIFFKDYSFLTGSVFFTKYCLAANSVFNIDKPFLYRNHSFRRNIIYAEETRLILRAIVMLLETAKANNLSVMQERISNMLNSENYERLITDSTYGFIIDTNDGNSIKENNIRTEVFELLVKANELIETDKHSCCITKSLSKFIQMRHTFLENI